MSEVMAIESIAAEHAKFQGYFVETRVPFKLEKGHSDLDVLGYNPRTKKSIMIECKACGSPEQYPSHNTHNFKKQFKEMLRKWGYFKKSPANNRWHLKKLDEIWYIIPGYCDNIKTKEDQISRALKQKVIIKPIHKLIIEIIEYVQEDMRLRRKRYANPALEFCRWLLRGYNSGRINSTDLKTGLEGKRQPYEKLKRDYFKECVKVVQKNFEKAKAGVNTRINTIITLAKFDKATITQLMNKAKKMRIPLNYPRIEVGLSTWQRLGIVDGNKNNGFFITPAFKKIIEEEKGLLKIRGFQEHSI